MRGWRAGLWAVVVAGGVWLFGCATERSPATTVPEGFRGPALSIPLGVPATASATPAPWARKAFTYGPDDRLALYRRASQDILVFPGAGTGLQNASTYTATQLYYDDRRDIFLYDLEREERVTLVSGDEVAGFAFAPAIDDHDTLYFLASRHPDLSEASAYAKYAREAEGATPSSKPLGSVLGKVFFLSPINAVGERHGGISSINVHDAGEPVVFTTGDGGLYAYYPATDRVESLLVAEVGGMHAHDVNIDPVWGRFVVWTDTEREGIYLLDRWSGQVDPLPITRLGFLEASGPSFSGKDPYHVLFTATLEDGSTRLMAFDIVTERLDALALFNLLP